MGKLLSKAFSILFDDPEITYRLVMIGLDASGKTTTLYRLKFGEVGMTNPTIGFNVETIEYKNLNFTVWDIGGQEMVRPLWRHYYKGTNGIIFMVDSSDRNEKRINEVHDELHRLSGEEYLKNAPVLIFNNKRDVKGSMTSIELTEALNLRKFKKDFYVQNCCAITGDGLYDGFEWLSKAISKNNK